MENKNIFAIFGVLLAMIIVIAIGFWIISGFSKNKEFNNPLTTQATGTQTDETLTAITTNDSEIQSLERDLNNVSLEGADDLLKDLEQEIEKLP